MTAQRHRRRTSQSQPLKYWVYIMASIGGTLYIGSTSELVKRAWQHKSGALEGFTKRYGCTRLVYCECYDDPRDSAGRERKLKGWTRARKIALIETANPRWQDIAEHWGCRMALPSESIAEIEERLRTVQRLVAPTSVPERNEPSE